jgi:hypothetical protein
MPSVFMVQNYENNSDYKAILKTKNRLNFNFEIQPITLIVVSPRLELGQAEPKTAVLPLHHETIVGLYF